MMLRAIILCSILFLSITSHAQFNHLWTQNYGGQGADYGAGIALDDQGNIYMLGRFSETADFDSGPSSETLDANGETDVYVQKLDPMGNLLWARSFGGPAEDRGHAIGVDASGNVYVTGTFRSTVDFDPGPGSFILASTQLGDIDAFIVKLNTDGGFEWAKQINSTGTEWGLAIAVDAAGNSYSAGYFSNTIDLDPGAGVDLATVQGSSPNDNDVFLIKLDADGEYIWGHGIGGDGQERAYGLELDAAGDLLLTGHFGKIVDFDPGPGVANLDTGTSSVALDAFLLKMTSDGEYIWAVNFGSTNDYDYGRSVKTDAESNIYYTGYFRATVDADPGPGVANITANGGRDAFLVKLDGNSNFLWARALGGTGNEYSRTLSINPQNGDVYIAVSQYSSPTVNWGTDECVNETEGITNVIEEVLALASYDTDGNHLCAFGLQTGQQGFYSAGYQTQMVIRGNVMHFLSNYSSSDTDYDPGSGSYTPPFAGGDWDVALSRYRLDDLVVDLGDDSGFCSGGFATLDVTVDDGTYLWQDGSTEPIYTVIEPGTYSVEVRSAGCVDKDTINLLGGFINNTITQDGSTLIANEDMVTYQWINCDDLSAIPGATEQVFNPMETGTYAVAINNNGCVDTSVCVSVMVLDTEELSFDAVRIYPNPVGAQGQLTVELNQAYRDVQLKIFSSDGKLVVYDTSQDRQVIPVDLSALPSGVYLLELECEAGIGRYRVVK